MNDCQALYPDESMSGEDEGEEDEDAEHGDEDVQEYDEQNFYDADTDPNDIELSVRGQQILRRLNVNFQNNSNFCKHIVFSKSKLNWPHIELNDQIERKT